MMKYVNLTTKTIRIMLESSSGQPKFLEIPPSGQTAIVTETRREWKVLEDGVPVTEIALHEIEGLPDPVPGVIYIVNGYVAQAIGSYRDDVVAPDIGKSAIKINGAIWASRGWRVYA